MKTKIKTKGYIIRSAAYAAFLACVIVGVCSAFNLSGKWSGLSPRSENLGSMTVPTTQTRTLTFADRVAYQRAIEDVYWRHRIWPKENASPKPPLDAVISQEQARKESRGLFAQFAGTSELLASPDFC